MVRPIGLSIGQPQPVVVIHLAVDVSAPSAPCVKLQRGQHPNAKICVDRKGVAYIPDQFTDLVPGTIVGKFMGLACQPTSADAEGKGFVFPAIDLLLILEA